jgi:hypothetical protein
VSLVFGKVQPAFCRCFQDPRLKSGCDSKEEGGMAIRKETSVSDTEVDPED